MAEESSLEPLYVVRYMHNDQEIDVTARGRTGEIAFQCYLDELSRQGDQGGYYRFISATELETPDDSVRQ